MKVSLVVSVIAVLAMVQMMAGPNEAVITCQQVAGDLAKCVPYLTSGGEPDPACCAGVKTLINSVQTPADKREACSCIKEAANRVPALKEEAARDLPTKCKVSMDIPISKNVNCDALN